MSRSPLTIASRLLLDRAGKPIIDLAGNRVAVNKSPQPLTRLRASLFSSSTSVSNNYGLAQYGNALYGGAIVPVGGYGSSTYGRR